ncbi:MAG TPA: carboxypeptidase regulatory-like domain-containing protein [Vicinamibacteria bacterium]|nr:carboxypeptidase regulatory-like domain-containing protein [Vicinamibacteria bacterium]
MKIALFVLALPAVTPQTPAPSPATTPPPPAELVGRIELVGADGQKTPAAGSVVWIGGLPKARPGPTPTMSSSQKRFTPHVIAVAQGALVTFPNVDKVFHNVFSRTAGSEFDLGLYRNGASRSVRFNKPGLVRVYCNIHPDMAGYVRVLDDAAFTTTDDEGSFRLAGLPHGHRTVQVWNERGGEKQFPVDLEAGRRRTLNVVLDGSSYRQVQHKNKFGRDYPPVTRDVDRY